MNGQPWTQRPQALILALMLIGATVAPPLLDAAEDVQTAQFEAEHDPFSCAPLHDHGACSQLAKSPVQVGWSSVALRRPDAVIRSAPSPGVPALPRDAAFLLHPPRGPPTPIS